MLKSLYLKSLIIDTLLIGLMSMGYIVAFYKDVESLELFFNYLAIGYFLISSFISTFSLFKNWKQYSFNVNGIKHYLKSRHFKLLYDAFLAISSLIFFLSYLIAPVINVFERHHEMLEGLCALWSINLSILSFHIALDEVRIFLQKFVIPRKNYCEQNIHASESRESAA